MNRTQILGAPPAPVPALIRWAWAPGFAWFALSVYVAYSNSHRPGADAVILNGLIWFLLALAVTVVGALLWWRRHNPAAYRTAGTLFRTACYAWLAYRATVIVGRHMHEQITEHDD